jgi:hypothetical protein
MFPALLQNPSSDFTHSFKGFYVGLNAGGAMGSSSLSPTYVSTFNPSLSPSQRPSSQPSRTPSNSPTSQPTNSPTLTNVATASAQLIERNNTLYLQTPDGVQRKFIATLHSAFHAKAAIRH